MYLHKIHHFVASIRQQHQLVGILVSLVCYLDFVNDVDGDNTVLANEFVLIASISTGI